MNSSSTGPEPFIPPMSTDRTKDGSCGGSLTLTEVHQQHAAFVRSLLKPRVLPTELSDLVQMSFIEIHRGLPAYDAARPIQPWIATIVFRTVERHRRRAAMRRRVEATFSVDPSEVVPSSEDCIEARDLLPKFLACLKERQLQIVLRHLRDEEPIDVISRDLGISTDGGYKLLQTAIAKLRDAAQRFEAIERRQLSTARPRRVRAPWPRRPSHAEMRRGAL